MKKIHQKVVEVKNNPNMEVEFMTLLERDREKIEEGRAEGIEEGREEGIEQGIELTKRVFKLSYAGKSIKEISKECNISEEEVERILS